jgi:hypothetical protein
MYDVPVVVPMLVPLRKSSYPVTPTLSVEGDHVTLRLDWVEEVERSAVGGVGA